jgi:hypothetical protein
MKILIKIGWLFLLIMSLQSCKLIIGVKTPRAITTKNIKKFQSKYNTPYCYAVNRDLFYGKIVDAIPVVDSYTRHDVIQPLQIIAFDREGTIVAKQINCRIPPKSKIPFRLDWGYRDFLDTLWFQIVWIR